MNKIISPVVVFLHCDELVAVSVKLGELFVDFFVKSKDKINVYKNDKKLPCLLDIMDPSSKF